MGFVQVGLEEGGCAGAGAAAWSGYPDPGYFAHDAFAVGSACILGYGQGADATSRASQTRNTLLLVQKLDALPSTHNQTPAPNSGSSLKINSASHLSKRYGVAATLSRSTFTCTQEYHWSGHNFFICRIGIAKSKDITCREYRGSQYRSTTTKTTYSLYPSFLSKSVRVMISCSGMSGPSIGLKTVSHMSWDMTCRLQQYALNDDLEGIQCLLRNRDISIFSECLFFVSSQFKVH